MSFHLGKKKISHLFGCAQCSADTRLFNANVKEYTRNDCNSVLRLYIKMVYLHVYSRSLFQVVDNAYMTMTLPIVLRKKGKLQKGAETLVICCPFCLFLNV